MAEAGDGRLPADVFAALDVPADRGGGVGVHAAGLRPSELRPVGGGYFRSDEEAEQKPIGQTAHGQDVTVVPNRVKVSEARFGAGY